MNPAHAQESPTLRRIALVAGDAGAGSEDRTLHAMRLLDTMLWVLKGTTRDVWTTASPEEADIVVVHRDAAAAWKARGKLVVEITHDQDVAGAGEDVLAYPFPAKRVLDLLEKLSGKLDARASSRTAVIQSQEAVISRPVAIVNPDRLSLLESLRTLRAVRNDAMWLVAREGADPVLWLRGDGAAFFATEAWLNSLHQDRATIARLDLRDGYPPPRIRVIERAGAELFWFAGFNASDTLAPWLDATHRYRATAWPDFGVMRPPAEVLRVVALLTAHSLDVQTLAARARVPLAVASRTLNAMSMCEALAQGELPIRRRDAANVQPRGGFTGFLKRLRVHLGLGESA